MKLRRSLYARPEIRLRRAMHQGCVRSLGGCGRDRRGGSRHRQALGRPGGLLHPRAGHRPRAVSVRPRRESRPVVRRRRRHPRPAGRSIGGRIPGHVRGPPPHDRRAARPTPRPQRRARLRCGPAPHQERLDPVWPGRCGDRPGGAGRPPCWCPRGGRLFIWTSTWGPAAATAVSNTCPARGCWRSGSTTGHPVRATRCCTPIWSSPTASRGRTAAGQPWTAGTCTGIGGRGRHLPGHLPARARPDTGGGVDSSGRSRQPGTPGDARGPDSWVLQAHRPYRGRIRGFSKRTGHIEAELDRLTEDGRERTPRLVKWTVHATRKPKEHEAPDSLYDRWRAEVAERGVDPDSLVWTVTGQTGDRDQDRTVSADASGRLFDRLAGPEGLTGHASTFARPDVLVALGAGLAGTGRTELEELVDRFLAERAVS